MGLGIKSRIKSYVKGEITPLFGPQMIRISPVGYACTNSCLMCWRTMKKVTKRCGLEKSELNWNFYEKMLDSLPFTVTEVEVVGGGEPLLFPKIVNLLQKIKEKKLIGSLITNGVVLSPKISELLVLSKWDRVRISINSGSRRAYFLTNGSNYFDKVVDNVDKLIKMRGDNKFPKVSLHFVLQKSNYKDVNNFIDLAKKLNVDQISFDTLINDSPKKIMLSDSENLQLANDLKQHLKKLVIENNIKEILAKLKLTSKKRQRSYFSGRYCQIVQSILEINSEGYVVPCCMAYGEPIAKNLKEMSVKQVWQAFSAFRKRLRQGEFEDFCYKRCNYTLNKK